MAIQVSCMLLLVLFMSYAVLITESRSDFVSYIASPVVTNWGDWTPMSYCPEGEFVVGFWLRMEGKQFAGDDTSLNAIQFRCSGGAILKPHDGFWGSWTDELTCPDSIGCRSTVIGFELLSETAGGDDTAANNLQLICNTCCNNNCGDHLLQFSSLSYAFDWGNWGSWTGQQRCPMGTAVCGLAVQVESKQGEGSGDDTALNNVHAACCSCSSATVPRRCPV